MTTLNYLDILATQGISGADSRYLGPGIQSDSDVLINKLGDGTLLDVVFKELEDIVSAVNSYRGGLAALLTYWTDRSAEPVLQRMTSEKFEEAGEISIANSTSQDPVMLLGFGFNDYDKRSSFSWKYLRGASFDQIRQSFVRILEADSNLVVGTILRRLFSNAEDVEETWGHVIRGLWSGTDTLAPLPYLGRTFSANHAHYLPSGSATIDSDDVEAAMGHVLHHGYGRSPSQRLVLLVSPAEAEVVSTFRAGVTNNNSKVAKFDFVPSSLAPPRISNESVIGETPTSIYSGLEIAGQYGKALVVEHELCPAGYFSVFATGGPNSAGNVIGYREHEQPEWRGLRMIPGYRNHPIIDQTYMRSFGVGVRHRGAACCFQLTANPSYTAPTIAI